MAIVTARPQTTRTRILGVVNGEGYQLALFDTPGIHKAKGPLNKRMVETALSHALRGGRGAGARRGRHRARAARSRWARPRRWIAEEVKRRRQAGRARREQDGPGAAGDPAPGHRGLPLAPRLGRRGPLLGAHRRERRPALADALARHLPASEAPLFPPDVLTDQAERAIVAEYVREQVMQQTRDELPYAAAVEVEEFDESERRDDGGLIRIGAVIWVERESQKAIVIGKGGSMLKRVGTRARERMERLLGAKVFLRLTVKVEERWSERLEALRRLGIAP